MRGDDPTFSAPKPWKNREKLFQWCWKWFTTGHYEEPMYVVFLIPSVAQFLEEHGVKREEVSRSFRMEFKGKGEKEAYVPPCLWKSGRDETSCITKRWGNSYMCCDFYLLEPFPNTVVEVKVAMPHQNVKSNFTGFKKALEKCEEWLKPDTGRYVKEKFGIERFEYGLALLIDLTGTAKYRNEWDSNVDEKYWFSRNVLPWHISI